MSFLLDFLNSDKLKEMRKRVEFLAKEKVDRQYFEGKKYFCVSDLASFFMGGMAQ